MELQATLPPGNGFLQGQQSLEEASEPMLAFSTLNSSAGKATVKVNNEANGGHKNNSELRPRWSNIQVIQCVVLLIIAVLIATLCSVFIKPEIYFSDYGKH